MTITDRLAAHITASTLTQEQRDVVAACVDAWITAFGTSHKGPIVAAEAPWYLWLDSHTLLVGMCDALTDEGGLVVNEYKTKRAARIKKDGQPYKGDSREEWLNVLANSPQCRIYALAAQRGVVIPHEGSAITMSEAQPRVRVRAVNKPEQPVYEGGRLVCFKRAAEVWTADGDAPFEYSAALCDQTATVVLTKANGIREQRKFNAKGPWALPSIHCTNKFGRLCEYHEPYCWARQTPFGITRFDPADPGAAAIVHAGADINDPELVIFSASSFEAAQWCDERYHILCTDGTLKEEGEALAIGGLFHKCVALIAKKDVDTPAQV